MDAEASSFTKIKKIHTRSSISCGLCVCVCDCKFAIWLASNWKYHINNTRPHVAERQFWSCKNKQNESKRNEKKKNYRKTNVRRRHVKIKTKSSKSMMQVLWKKAKRKTALIYRTREDSSCSQVVCVCVRESIIIIFVSRKFTTL